MHFLVLAGTWISVAAAAFWIFRKVAFVYERNGRLTTAAALLEAAIFFLHGCSSLIFIPMNLESIEVRGAHFFAALVLGICGLTLILWTMSFLGWSVSMGVEVSGLRTSGPYRYSRNPQLVAYGFVLIGYALLWPSWSGAFWILLYLLLAHIMIRTEEAHLLLQYKDDYRSYCCRTPRILGIPER